MFPLSRAGAWCCHLIKETASCCGGVSLAWGWATGSQTPFSWPHDLRLVISLPLTRQQRVSQGDSPLQYLSR